jgi:hypothetical protein
MTWTKTSLLPRILWPYAALLACGTDPGDVGSGTDASDTASVSATDATSSATLTETGPQTGEGTSAASSSDTTDAGSAGTSAASSSETTDAGSEGTSAASSSSDGSGGETTGTPVENCGECGPDEGCVGEVAFGIEYYCVPWPEDCGVEFNCACAGEYCVDPFTECFNLPDPPQRAINCECPNC